MTVCERCKGPEEEVREHNQWETTLGCILPEFLPWFPTTMQSRTVEKILPGVVF